MKENEKMLGKKTEAGFTLPYAFEAPVDHGRALGRKLGAPTLNQTLKEETAASNNIPFGVYFSRCFFGGGVYNAITNIGVAPTVTDIGEVRSESHLFGFSGDIYGVTVKTELLFFRRPEVKFRSENELMEAIKADISAAEKYFSETSEPDNTK